ncbi:MAG: PIN domain-containing protein [Kiritimatiellae bacterium]|nr:PIN domain-containing protein [Kiritimatiellia bacterium]
MGVIELDGALGQWVAQSLEALTCSRIELSHEIAAGAYALPGAFHKDPADRIIVATARLSHLTVLTADERILTYRHVRSRDARK